MPGHDVQIPARSMYSQHGAQNRNLSSFSNDIRYLHNSVTQINDKLNQILSFSASSSRLRGSIDCIGSIGGLEVYGNTFPSYLDKLTILNNKLLRILQKKRTHLL